LERITLGYNAENNSEYDESSDEDDTGSTHNKTLTDWISLPHWQWLKGRKPWLTFAYSHP
jgi:hypothetical protein